MIEYVIGIIGVGVAGGVAYGDLRGKIGKLEGQMELISKDLKVIMANNGCKK
ncbi:unnamed protein product [marine sediment metagenome]|uniref:Uncharacterized protein n=1 Tax=marine sediment metagenome TaxID=412755 RepID=X1IGF4_9ZZZZ